MRVALFFTAVLIAGLFGLERFLRRTTGLPLAPNVPAAPTPAVADPVGASGYLLTSAV